MKTNKIIIGIIIFSIIGNLFFILIEPKASDLKTWIMVAKALLKGNDFYKATFIPGHYFAYLPLFAEAIIFPITLLFNPSNEFQFLLALRIVFLSCNVLIGIVLWKLFKIENPIMLAFWFLNPLIWGISQYQFDSIVALFLILSIYFFIKNKLFVSSFLIGASIAFKLYPVLIFPVLLLNLHDKLERIKYFMFSTIVPLISCLPFLSSKFFLKSVFEFNVSRGLTHLFLLAYFFMLFLTIVLKRSLIESIASILILFCIFYVGIYSIQYLITFLPFLLLNLNFYQTKINLLIYNLTWITSFLLRYTPFLYRKISLNIPQSLTQNFLLNLLITILILSIPILLFKKSSIPLS